MNHLQENLTSTFLIAEKMMQKGSLVPIVGGSGDGKSTVLGLHAKGLLPFHLLQVRESSGSGTLVDTLLAFTNHPALDPEKLYIQCTLNSPSDELVADHGNGMKFYFDLLFAAVVDYVKGKVSPVVNENGDLVLPLEYWKDIFQAALSKKHSNDSYCAKLQGVDTYLDRYKVILESFSQVEVEELKTHLIEVVDGPLGNTKITVDHKEKFRSSLVSKAESKKSKPTAEDESLLQGLQLFLDGVKGFFLEEIRVLIKKIKALQKLQGTDEMVVKEAHSGNFVFLFFLAQETLENPETSQISEELIQLLLHSESNSKEYLVSKLSLCCRGKDGEDGSANLYQAARKEQAVMCFPVDGNPQEYFYVQNLRFMDTKGIGHSSKESEAEGARILQTTERYNRNHMVLLDSLEQNVVTKEAERATDSMFQSISEKKGETQVLVVYSKFDKLVGDMDKSSVSHQSVSLMDSLLGRNKPTTSKQERAMEIMEKRFASLVEDNQKLGKNVQGKGEQGHSVQFSRFYYGLGMDHTVKTMLEELSKKIFSLEFQKLKENFQGNHAQKPAIYTNTKQIMDCNLDNLSVFFQADAILNPSQVRHRLLNTLEEIKHSHWRSDAYNLSYMADGYSRETTRSAKYHLDSLYLDMIPPYLSPMWQTQRNVGIFSKVLWEPDPVIKQQQEALLEQIFFQYSEQLSFKRRLIRAIYDRFAYKTHEGGSGTLWCIFLHTRDQLFPDDRTTLTPMMESIVKEVLLASLKDIINRYCVEIPTEGALE